MESGRNFWVTFLIMFSCMFLIGPDCGQPPPGEAPQAVKVLQAIHDLESDDYVVVRKAIHTLEKNLDAPNILLAVRPLSRVANDDNGRQDSYTRCKAIPVLFRMGVYNSDRRRGQRAIDNVIDLLHNSPSDLVRNSCATTIGVNGYAEAMADLEQALGDPSVYVRDQSCLALLRITSWQYSSEDCNPPSTENVQMLTTESGTPQSTKDGVENEEPDTIHVSSAPTPEILDTDGYSSWLRTHILLPFPETEQQ